MAKYDKRQVKKVKIRLPHETVEVPHIDAMDDETFLKHLELRHAKECKINGEIHRHAMDKWVNMYRIFHQRLHRLAVPGQYDHVHEED